MKTEAIKKARARLTMAEEQLVLAEGAQNFDQFGGHWSLLLTSLNTVWTSLEQGAKGIGQAAPWFGAKKAERKADPLLSYLHHARNDDEHGLNEVLQDVPGQLRFPPHDQNYSQNFHLRSLGMGPEGLQADVVTHDGKPFGVEVTPGHAKLAPVKDRGVTYSPPTEHLGVPLVEKGPIQVAQHGIAYTKRLIDEAEQLV